jgi:hypothetical protein
LDGHPTRGSFRFAVTGQAQCAAPKESPTATDDEAGSQSSLPIILSLAGLGLFGALALATLKRNR